MKNSDIHDPLFREAVGAIENGDIDLLTNLITENYRLVQDKIEMPQPAYFRNPYLVWFVADNPIRNGRLPANIIAVTQLLIGFIKTVAAYTMQYQLDYSLVLVATGHIAKASGVQIALMDILIDSGAIPGGVLGALANGNIDAAAHLINRGGKLTLAAAVGLGSMEDVIRLTALANKHDLLLALTMAAFYGQADMITYLINLGADPNGYPENDTGFHSHATPLHQSINSGSLACVKILVEAGARLDMPDKIYNGTPLDWALYAESQSQEEETKEGFAEILEYLKGMDN